MVAPSNVRLPDRVDRALTSYIERTGTRKSTVISVAVDEWLRLKQHPHIRFVEPVPGERRAALVDGPEVWSVAEAWLQHEEGERDVAGVAESTGLRTDQVESALSYWADNRSEIDGLMVRIHAAQEEAFAAWERRRALDALA
ncbi:MAG: hypothetical protein LBK95_17285 [Bifidobacteriaceae bacterium]|jgi:hypothetical protein|nr:hypothetical protein [Bifidobacteriaceae bacterium]